MRKGGPQVKKDTVNRETWLRAAYALLRRKLLKEAPERVAISWSFPAKGGTSANRRRIGECHYKGGSADGKIEGDRVLLISPTLRTPYELVEVLLHEMVHATLPMGCGHRAQFSRLAARVGLVKPWTATKASPELAKRIQGEFLKALPVWPGGFLTIQTTQKNRQLKAVCQCDEPRIIRGSAKLFEQGPIVCGLCDEPFNLD
jgi:hypothetical protein